MSFSFQISFFLSSYIVPLTLISILYVGMLMRLWHSVPGSKVSAESRRGKKRVTRMVVFVVLGTSSAEFSVFVESFIRFPSFIPKQTKSFRYLLAASSRKLNFLSRVFSERP